MKEELIRIENGRIGRGEHQLNIEMEVARGESIGIFFDNLVNSDVFLEFFRGNLRLMQGKSYLFGERIPTEEMGKKIVESAMILEKQSKFSAELTAWDFLIALRSRTGRRDRKEQLKRFYSPEAEEIRRLLEIDFQWKDSLVSLTPLSFCRLFLFKVWFYHYEIIVLGHITEMLRENDINKLMEYTEYFLQRGMAFLLVDQENDFLFSHTSRIDIIKNGMTCYRLFPEQYGEETLIRILKGKEWKNTDFRQEEEAGKRSEYPAVSSTVLEFDKVRISQIEELSFQIRKGEIGLLLDRNYQTAKEIQNIFLNGKHWEQGQIRVNGKSCRPGDLTSLLGKKIGIQLENPGKRGKTLYYNLTGLENLSNMLVPKTGRWLVKKKIERSIMREAETWFDTEKLKQKVSQWSVQDRLKLSYYKWYLVNPQILICFFPFSGTDFWMHQIVMDMLSVCAEKGMGILMISTDIEGICERINNADFINRIRYIDKN